MNYSIYIVGLLVPVLLRNTAKGHASSQSLEQKLAEICEKLQRTVGQHGQNFLSQPVTPERSFALEHQFAEVLREAGRQMVQVIFNRVEPAVEALPKHVHFE